MSSSEKKPCSKRNPSNEKQLAANRAIPPNLPDLPAIQVRPAPHRTPANIASPLRTSPSSGSKTSTKSPLRVDLIAVYQPVNSQELFALERMAIFQQAMLRASRLESGLFTSCMNESFGPEGAPSLPFRQEMAAGIEITRELNRNFILADGFQLLVRQGNSIPLFLRYQAQVERLYRRAVEEFERVKKLRPELPNEPIFEDDEPLGDSPEPQPDEPVPAPDAAPVPPAPNEPISAPDPQPLDPILPAALAWPPVCKKQRLTKRATSNYLGRSSRRTSPRTVRRIAKGANSRVEIGNDSNLAGASRHGRRGR